MLHKALLIACLAVASLAAAQSSFQLEGTVQDFVSSRPIQGLTISLVSPGYSATAISDSGGRFQVRLPSGTYKIDAQNLKVLIPPGDAGPNTVTIGTDPIQEIRLYRLQTGVISGRVTNSQGAALSNALVRAFEVRYFEGLPMLMPALAVGGMTDDRGQYRISSVRPGRYFVRVETGSPQLGFQVSNYFPGKAQLEEAAEIPVGSGEETDHVDWVAQPTEVRHISGTVTSSDKLNAYGVPAIEFYEGFRYSLTPLDGRTGEPGSTQIRPNSDGSFGIAAPPGMYELLMIKIGAHGGTLYAGKVTVDIRYGNVEDIRIPLKHTISVKGNVILKQNGSSEGAEFATLIASSKSQERYEKLNPPSDSPQLYGELGVPRIDLVSPTGSRFSNIDLHGSFTIPEVTPGRFAVQFENIPEEAYVSRVDIGGMNSSDLSIPVGESEPASITITVELLGKAVKGFVEDAKGKRAAYAPVVLVPSPELRWNSTLYKSVRADANGDFEFKGVGPGDYKVFSWRRVPPSRIGAVAEVGAAFVSPFEDYGTPVAVVNESSPESVRAVIIEN